MTFQVGDKVIVNERGKLHLSNFFHNAVLLLDKRYAISGSFNAVTDCGKNFVISSINLYSYFELYEDNVSNLVWE